jgi:hypothetical protein
MMVSRFNIAVLEFIFKPITTAGGILTKLILKISGQGKPEPITLVLIGTEFI